MHRFYLPPSQCTGPAITLTGTEAHHAADVLRVRPGESIVILDGVGNEFQCIVREANRKLVTVDVKNKSISPAPASAVTLVQAVPKGKLIETIIQKATELGAARVIPLLSERVTTRLDDDAADQKGNKWQQTAIEAIKQCGQRWLPQVETPIALPALLKRMDNVPLGLIGSLEADAKHPREYFSNFKQVPESVRIWIGPEGDFTTSEYAAIRKSGALPMNFGPLVLRCDTAAMYALSIISYELQAWKRQL